MTDDALNSRTSLQSDDIQAKIIAMWDRASANYDSHVGHGMNHERERRAWTELLHRALPPPPADVLDVGTGTGVIALLLGEFGYTVRGIDLSEKMLARARSKATEGTVDNVTFERGDATDPPGTPASVDIVFSRHVVHLLIDPAAALANWYRLVRPGGVVVIVDGLWGRDPEDRIDDDVQAALPLRAVDATTDDVRRFVEAAGFVDVMVTGAAEIDAIERELAPADEPPTPIPHYVATGHRPA
jgi:SAM-dependent methyltransferase